MSQAAALADSDNPYVAIVYDHLGDPVPASRQERQQRYLALQTSLQSRLAATDTASAEASANLALMAEAIAIVEDRLATGPRPARQAAAPKPANQDHPPPVRPRTGLSASGFVVAVLTAALVSIATFLAIDRYWPAIRTGAPASVTLLDELSREAANPDRYQAYFDLMARLEAVIDGYHNGQGAYPATRNQAFLAVNSVDLFQGSAPDPANADLWRFWESLSYASNGKDYKLISVGLGRCTVVRILRPDLLDPKRAQHPFDCLAFGVWTAGAREF